MTTIYLNLPNWRSIFPAFADPAAYPDAMVQAQYDIGTAYISNKNYGCSLYALTLPQQTQALNLMCAHLLALSTAIVAGDTPGITTAATVDKVSVTLQPPPEVNQWQYWLNQTPYGQQFLALLQARGVGGMWFGGWPVAGAFRR